MEKPKLQNAHVIEFLEQQMMIANKNLMKELKITTTGKDAHSSVTI